MDETVQLEANALDRGNGGKIVCWSDGTTFFGGHAEVKGGAIGGDGGFIEISGKQQIFYRGSTDRFALFGKNGTLSLDPESNFKISTLTNYNVNHLYQLEQPTADIANLSVDTLIGELKKGPVTIKTAFQGEGGTAGHILFDPSASRTYDSPYPLTLLSTGKEGIIWQGSLINTGTGNIELLADLGGISITPLNKDQPALIQTAGNLSLGTSNQPVFGKISIEGAQEQFARVQTIGQGNISIHNNAGVEITSSKNAPATIQFENGNCEIVSADSLSLLGKENSRASIHGSGQLTLAAKNLNVHGDTGAASIQLGGTFHIRHLEEGIQVFAGNNSATIQGNTLLFENIQSDIELFSENAVASISAKDRLWIQNEGTTHLGAYNQKAFIHSDGILEIHTGKDFILYAEKASASIQSKKSLHLHAIHNILLNGSFEGQAVFESPNADIFVGRHLHLFSNSHISTHHGTLFLSVAKNLEMDNPLAIKPPMIQSGKIQLNVGENLHLNDRGSICTTSGKFSASIGHSLYLDDSAQIYAKGGALELTALHGNIHLKRESEIHSETDGTLITAGRSILLEGFSKIKSQEGNGLTLIVDHLHPTSIGEGGLVVASTASLESGNAPLTIYTAKRSLNSIDGTLNGLRLANSPLYLNTKEEQWGAFYPLTSTPSKPPDISPLIALLTAPKEPAAFVVYHKETGLIQSGNQTLSQIIFDQMVVNYIGPFISELFRDLHPYSEYIKNAETFNVIHSENHEKRKVPFSIKRRTFNHRAAIPYKEVNNGL